MHKAIERKMLREIAARPADVPRERASADDGNDAEGARAEARPTRGAAVLRTSAARPGTPKPRRRDDPS
ncbi:MAG TPA: hypothetical protein VEA81_01710 [Burkholderiaceae bacterium]|nr:hypothetical protein [Burkholderiaceae bacterium]